VGYFKTAEEYNPSTDSWRTVAAMPTARHSLAAAVVDGKIYAIGGYYHDDANHYLKTVEEYNPNSDNWRTVAAMPTKRFNLAAASVDGKIYAVGGNDGSSAVGTVEEYNPITDSWRTVAAMPTKRFNLAAAVVDEKIYTIGGYNGNKYFGTVEEYNPSTDSWRTVAAMPTARHSLVAAVVDGKIYAIGGHDGSNRLRTVEEYDPKTNKWRVLAAMPTARYDLAAASVGGKIYAIGGYSGNYLNTVEEYTPPRESGIVASDNFAVANHIKALIASPADGAFLSGAVNVMGTTMVTEGSLNSWILDFASGEHPTSGYTPISISSTPVKDALLATWDTTTRDDGVYTLRLRVTDANAITLETYIVVTLDNTPPDAPMVQINSPAGFDFIKSNATITISGSTEAKAVVKIANLLDQNGAPFKDVKSNVVIDGSGVISGNVNVGELTGITGLKLGLVVQDRANNPSPQGISNGLTVDDDKPQVSLLSPANGAYFNKAPIIFSGTATDTPLSLSGRGAGGEGSGVAKVEIHTGLGDWTPVVGNVNWIYEYTPPSADVLLTVKARAKDKTGNEQITTAINVFYFSTWPTANISEPLDNAEVSGLVKILGDADDTDADYSDLSYKLEYAEGADAQAGWKLIVETKNKPVKNDLLAQWQAQSLPEGAYTLRLTVKNKQSEVSVKRRNINVKAPPMDTTPPATVTDLVTSDPKSDSITLIWTAPGDDGDVGTASQYDIRYSESAITEANFSSATKVANPPKPQPAGSKETLVVTSLLAGTTYYFAIKTADEALNWSPMSNVAMVKTTTTQGVYQTTLKLTQGINIISLSLKPETPWTAKTIAQELGSTIVIRALDGNFEAYVAKGGIGEDFPIEANKGYIVNVTEPVNYTLLGTIWGEPVAAAPSIETENPTWAFVVTGVILRKQSFRTPNSANIVRITNLRTGYSTTAKIDGNGRFIATFVDFSRRSVIEVDDEIELSFIDKHGNLLSKVIRRIEPEQVERAYLNTLIELRPVKTALFQNYPNPFNPDTWIPYQIAQDAQVKIEIFNITGKLVRRIELGDQAAGWYVTKDKAAYWDGCNETGEVVASGIYFYKLRAGNYSAVRKLLIVK
jgi:N-acetylneuraminic acid mutarotase